MIKVEFSLAIALYLIFAVCLILIFWLVFEKRGNIEASSLENIFFWQCAICTYVYVDSRHSTISQCPRCGSYNKKEKEGEV
jgi:rubrerythrin